MARTWRLIQFMLLIAQREIVHHDDVIKWKYFPFYWPFVRGIYRVIPLTKASDAEHWCFLWSALTNDWANTRDAEDLRRHRAHCDMNVIINGPAGLYYQWRVIQSNIAIFQNQSFDTQHTHLVTHSQKQAKGGSIFVISICWILFS